MNEYIGIILKLRDEGVKNAGNFDYGANVVPVIEYYKKLTTYDERNNFIEAIKKMLTSDDNDIREYAVTLCIGFVTFRDAV